MEQVKEILSQEEREFPGDLARLYNAMSMADPVIVEMRDKYPSWEGVRLLNEGDKTTITIYNMPSEWLQTKTNL